MSTLPAQPLICPPSSPQGAAEGEDVVLLKGGSFRGCIQRSYGGDVGQVWNSREVLCSQKEFDKNVGNVWKQQRNEYSFCFQLLSSPWVDIYGSG